MTKNIRRSTATRLTTVTRPCTPARLTTPTP
ncbi:hypothetical protein GA0115233_10377 [Streptomyces sp. DI166]|nr:hypothetical protein GA0115233_10377 [Streptomyces sp. DI166]